MPRVSFYFDVGSPYAHLAAQRLELVLPEPVHWQPVLLGGLFKLTGRSSWALGDERAPAGWDGGDRASRYELWIGADALARSVAGRLPHRDAGGHVRLRRRAWSGTGP